MSQLVDIVVIRQRATQQTDKEIAEELGISEQMWNFIRRGKEPLGYKALRGIYRRWPELGPYVLLEIMGDVTEGPGRNN